MRRSAAKLRILRWYPFQVQSVINWCGHQLETIVVPGDQAGEWYAEITVMGEASWARTQRRRSYRNEEHSTAVSRRKSTRAPEGGWSVSRMRRPARVQVGR